MISHKLVYKIIILFSFSGGSKPPPYAVIEGAILISFPNQFTKKRIDIPAKYDII